MMLGLHIMESSIQEGPVCVITRHFVQTLGESKLNNMMECKDFKRGIRMLEWYNFILLGTVNGLSTNTPSLPGRVARWRWTRRVCWTRPATSR